MTAVLVGLIVANSSQRRIVLHRSKQNAEIKLVKRSYALILSILWLAAWGWFYAGFFSPDPLVLGAASIKENIPPILWLIWVAVPIAALVPLVLFWLVILGVINQVLVLVVLGACLFTGLLAFPFASEIYYALQFKRNLDDYHAFLQLNPSLYEPRKEKPTLKLFFLGGSTTAWSDSSGKDWPSRVESYLSEYFPGERIEASNLAREWYTSAHSLYHYSTNLRQHQPDIVVIMHAINDLLINADFSIFSTGQFRRDYGHFLGPTRLIVQQQTFAMGLINKIGNFWYHEPRKQLSVEQFPGLSAFGQNLDSLRVLTEADGAKFVVMNQPNIYRADLGKKEIDALYMLNQEAVGDTERWNFTTALRAMQSYNEASRAFAAANAIPFIDLEAVVPKSLEYFSDDVHYTDKSFPLIAPVIAKELKEVIRERLRPNRNPEKGGS